MNTENLIWKIQPQEQDNDYFFNGKYVMTASIAERLSKEEINSIIAQTLERVHENNGADYLQVFVNEAGDKIFFIDQLSKSMFEGDGYTKEQKKGYNTATMLFSYEY